MILTATEIEKGVENGTITIDPFDKSRLNPNSYNFRLSGRLIQYTSNTLDSRSENLTVSNRYPQ